MRLGTVSHPWLHKWAVVLVYRMLHWPHSLFNRLKGGGMCAQMCSMSCWGPNPQVGSLYKTTARGESYHMLLKHRCSSAVSHSAQKRTKQEQNLTLWHANKHWGMHQWWPFFPFFLLLSITVSYKANTVVAEIRVNTGCCDVCVVSDWPYAVDIPDI